MKDNARAQSLPPSAVVSLVALETSCGALGSTQLRNKNMETSKTYFFSSSCLCVSGVSGRAVGGEENDFFLKYGRRRLRRCGVGTAVHREKESSTYRKHSIQKRRKKHLRFSDGCDAAAHQRAVHPICGRRGFSRRKKRERETSRSTRSRSAKCRGRGRRNRTSHLFHPQLPRYPPIRIRTFCSRGLSCGERQCRRSGEE